jgi:hypothetical protein
VAYPTLVDLQGFLGNSVVAEEPVLQAVLDATISLLEQYTGRSFVESGSEARRFRPVPGRAAELWLEPSDLRTITSVLTSDGEAVSAADYYGEPVDPPFNILVRVYGGVWTYQPGGYVTITGTWGYTDVCPEDLYLSLLQASQHFYIARRTGAHGAVTTAARGLLVRPGALPPTVLDIWRQWRRGGL